MKFLVPLLESLLLEINMLGTQGRALLDPHDILLRAGLSLNDSFADFGSGGLGHFLFAASDIVGRDGSIFALDKNERALEHLESGAKMRGISHLETVHADMKDGEVKKQIHEQAVVSFINLGKDLTKEAIDNALQSLNDDGKILIIDWNESSRIAPSSNKIRKSAIERIMGELKLKKVDEFAAGPHHWGQVYTK